MSKNRIKIAILLSVIIVIGFVSYIYTQNNQSIKEQVVINYYSQPDINGVVSEIISNFEKLHPDIKVNLVELPPNTDDKLITIKKAFQSGEMQVDVFDSDIVWPPIFAASGWAEPLDEHVSKEELEKFLPESVNANLYMGQLWGLPYRIDAGMLYYRKDLLEKYNKNVPMTWDELVETSTYIMEREDNIKGFGASWDEFEGLTANALEYIWSFGGSIFSDTHSQQVNINTKESIDALSFMVDMIHKHKITSNEITVYSSGDVRESFFNGDIIFMRDWSSGWELSQDPQNSEVVGKVGISELPLGDMKGNNYTTLGGWQVMVSSFSNKKEAAIEFAKYRTSEEAQKVGALKMSHLPSIKKLYNDSEINESMPFLKYMYPSFEKAYLRPVSPYYAEISKTIQNSVHRALLNELTPTQAIELIEMNLKNITQTKQVVAN
ncbi:ABC transporter substrate-binding protein [Acetoanaerobium noterae]|uniref:ABC transporter substrate-binding protein n=1 Tax=Acetoanaerobium noterae TaxID=745369 RepID=UPI0032420219